MVFDATILSDGEPDVDLGTVDVSLCSGTMTLWPRKWKRGIDVCDAELVMMDADEDGALRFRGYMRIDETKRPSVFRHVRVVLADPLEGSPT